MESLVIRRTPVEIRNMVVTSKMADSFDLRHLQENFPAALRAKRSPAWIGLRIGNPERYAAVYPSGVALLTGVCELVEAEHLMATLKDTLHLAGAQLWERNELKVRNIVGVADLGLQLDLDRLAQGLGTEAEYEPEQFPGLVLRVDAGKALVFRTGRVVITGARSKEDLEAWVKGIETILARFAP